MATRLYTPERFSMTAGVNVPFDLALIEDLYDALPRRLEDINTGIPKSDDVRHALPVHVRHLARVGVVAAPATGIHKMRKAQSQVARNSRCRSPKPPTRRTGRIR